MKAYRLSKNILIRNEHTTYIMYLLEGNVISISTVPMGMILEFCRLSPKTLTEIAEEIKKANISKYIKLLCMLNILEEIRIDG